MSSTSGTSLVVAAQVHGDFHAQTALEAMARIPAPSMAMPASITFDRDTRWVGSAGGRDFPSAFVRFLLCLGIQPYHLPAAPTRSQRLRRALSSLASSRNVCWWRVLTPLKQVREAQRGVRAALQPRSGPIRRSTCGESPASCRFSLPACFATGPRPSWTPMPGSATCMASTSFGRCVTMAPWSWMTSPITVQQARVGQYVDLCVNAVQQEVIVWQEQQPHQTAYPSKACAGHCSSLKSLSR